MKPRRSVAFGIAALVFAVSSPSLAADLTTPVRPAVTTARPPAVNAAALPFCAGKPDNNYCSDNKTIQTCRGGISVARSSCAPCTSLANGTGFCVFQGITTVPTGTRPQAFHVLNGSVCTGKPDYTAYCTNNQTQVVCQGGAAVAQTSCPAGCTILPDGTGLCQHATKGGVGQGSSNGS